jgi:hypothetical protein
MSAATDGASPLVKKTDPLRTGLQTERWSEGTSSGYQITWIHWDSPFRETPLRIGDVIIRANGVDYTRANPDLRSGDGIGGLQEDRYWQQQGSSEGTPIQLQVRREHELLEVSAPLSVSRFYYDAQSVPSLGPGGPPRSASDGFRGIWSSWYEAHIKSTSYVLNHGWRHHSFNSRQLLKEHEERKPQVDLLLSKYPGPFAESVAEEWRRVAENLRGTRWEERDIDLSFRNRQQRLLEQVREAGRQALARFMEELAPRRLEAFPALDPIEGDVEKIAGRVVELARLTQRNLRSDAGHPWFIAGDPRSGFYFLDADTPEVQRFFDAQLAYQRAVSPELRERYQLFGEVLPEPRMLVVDGRAEPGIALRLLGAVVDDIAFVDLRPEPSHPGAFAGQELAEGLPGTTVPDDAPPEAVLDACFEALKQGQQAAWRAFFADWRAEQLSSGHVHFNAAFSEGESTYQRAWESARRLLANEVYGIKRVHVPPVVTLLEGTEFEGAPSVRECRIEVEHVGRFDGEYRGFKDFRLHRVWVLQSLNGGPWRILDVRGL